MPAITTIGLDIAKSVFQVHGVDAEGHLVIRRRLKRRRVAHLPVGVVRDADAARLSDTFEPRGPPPLRLVRVIQVPPENPPRSHRDLDWRMRSSEARSLR